MEHAYLFQSARWRAEGVYHTKDGQTVPLTGETTLSRTSDTWTLTGFLDVALTPPARFENTYTISLTDNPAELRWTSVNPALGTLEGRFTVLPGIITSAYMAADGVHSGSEMMMQVSESEYKMQGVLNENGDPQDWWEGRLVRV